ncbi:MAG TPA: lamin tail domain-containing protein, partial [Pyrinomonadaceae bacterium]|nr:lamin tail domain-containing protein [Pyrinomonadaceae bacterium]
MNPSIRPAAPAARLRQTRQKTIKQAATIFFLVLFAFALFMALLPQATKVGAQILVDEGLTDPPPLLISEFRLRGPNGANDEFIEIHNNSDTDVTVATIDLSAGYSVVASDGIARCLIPEGTIIPARGHYLCVNSVGYSLASYPAGNGTTATGDATYTTNIPDNAGIAIFNNNSGGGSYTLANRLDAVGSTSEANTLYKEGTGYPALTPFSIDYSFYRDNCGKSGSITTFGGCPLSTPKDTNNNAADFVFVDTNGTSAGAGQRLGAPGPEN